MQRNDFWILFMGNNKLPIKSIQNLMYKYKYIELQIYSFYFSIFFFFVIFPLQKKKIPNLFSNVQFVLYIYIFYFSGILIYKSWINLSFCFKNLFFKKIVLFFTNFFFFLTSISFYKYFTKFRVLFFSCCLFKIRIKQKYILQERKITIINNG